MPPEGGHQGRTEPDGGASLVTQRISDIEVSRLRLRTFLANRAIALGWALKGSCKPCAHRLFTTARWLVPEAQRFLLHRTGSDNRNRRIFEFAVHLGRLLSRIPPRVVGGFLIVSAFVGSLDLAMRTTTTETQPLVQNSAFRHEAQMPSETSSLSEAQIAPVPLPLRKPERVYKLPNGKKAKANPTTQKRVAQKKKRR
jgi:hypothetical protein